MTFRFPLLLREVFLQVLRFCRGFPLSLKTNNSQFQFDLKHTECSVHKQNYKFQNMDRVLGVSGSSRDGNIMTSVFQDP